MDQLAWHNSSEHLQKLRNERAQCLDAAIQCNEHNNSDRQARGILLVLQVSVARNQNVEFPAGLAKKLTVLEPGPTDLLHRANLVACKLLPQLPRQRLVKQDAHRL